MRGHLREILCKDWGPRRGESGTSFPGRVCSVLAEATMAVSRGEGIGETSMEQSALLVGRTWVKEFPVGQAEEGSCK